MTSKIRELYEKYEVQAALAFFIGGIVFDIFTLADIDDWFSITQQIVYLVLVGGLLIWEILRESDAATLPLTKFKNWLWEYRSLIIHFILGSLLSIYSLFFIKSASIFSSFIFLLVMAGLMVANELPIVQRAKINIKFSLWVLCVFSFFSMIFPVILGFVGWVPFILATGSTILVLWLILSRLQKILGWNTDVINKFVYPGISAIGLFLVFYLFGWIPPVPIAIQSMGIYHKIERADGKYLLHHERSWWKLWQSGDQEFVARPGDELNFFAEIYSPSRFSDDVIIHWLYKTKQGWKTSDKVRMGITGGRRQGFRGYSIKKNFQPGEWRTQVETTDGREIGRIYTNVTPSDSTEPRAFEMEVK